MDRPKSKVSWLESFPFDIWAYFVRYLPGEDIGRLMMTGATFLRQRLKSPGMLKSITLGENHFTLKSLPKFLNDLPSFDSLLIHSYYDELDRGSGLRIDLIPSGVRKLELIGVLRNGARTLFGEGDSTLKLSKHLPHLQILRVWCLDLGDYSWVAYFPQTLTKLNVRHWNGTVELPSSLIHFKSRKVTLSSHSHVSKLPPALESFVVVYFVGLDFVVPLLPPSIIKLSLGEDVVLSADHHLSPQNLLEQLPRSLTWLTLPCLEGSDFETNPELISMLPSTLTSLKLTAILPCSAWALLPRQLTHLDCPLSISGHSAACDIVDHQEVSRAQPIPFDSLPKSITNLALWSAGSAYFCLVPAICNGSYFPQLTSLRILDLQLSPESAQLLPPSLTHLVIGNFCEQVCQHLPRSLTKLTSLTTLMSPNLIEFLPDSLVELHLRIDRAVDPWFDYKTGERFDSMSELEEYSIHEKCLSTSFDWKEVSPLPSRLTSLDISHAQTLGDSFMMRQHLPNLTSLRLGHSEHFTDLCIPLLPAHLVLLDLNSSSKISGKSFEFLPRCLTELYLNSSEQIFDSDIQHLPRTLSGVYLDRAIHLTDLCVPSLPPQLRMLTMGENSHISPSSFAIFSNLTVRLKKMRFKQFGAISVQL